MAGGHIGQKFFALRSALTYISYQKKFQGHTTITHESPWGGRGGGILGFPPPTKPNRDFTKKTLNAEACNEFLL